MRYAKTLGLPVSTAGCLQLTVATCFAMGSGKKTPNRDRSIFPNATAHPCSLKNEDMKLLRGTSLVRWQHHYFYEGIVRENSFLGVRILAISIHKLMMFIVGSYSDLSKGKGKECRCRSWTPNYGGPNESSCQGEGLESLWMRTAAE